MDDALGHLVPTAKATTMEEAVLLCQKKAKAGDLVLLAPGCASFDMFSGYEERGRIFTECVQRLIAVPQGGRE